MFFRSLKRRRILPVLSIHDTAVAVHLVDALVEGGLSLVEVALRTECALDVITELAGRDDIQVGAGTVLNAQQCQRAANAGATFIVSPGMDNDVIKYCRKNSLPCLPGIGTATELQRAYNRGVRAVKFFPAQASGGPKMLEALAAPFGEMRFVPTGGVNLDNLQDYLAIEQAIAVGGSWMVDPALYRNGDFSKVVTAVRDAVDRANNANRKSD